MGRGETRGWGRQVAYSGWLPGGDRVSRIPPPHRRQSWGAGPKPPDPSGSPGPRGSTQHCLPSGSRAPRALLDHFGRPERCLAFSSLAKTGTILGVAPREQDRLPGPARRVRDLAPGWSSCFRSAPRVGLQSEPNPPDFVPTFLEAGGLGALGPRIYCARSDPLGNKATLQFPGLA